MTVRIGLDMDGVLADFRTAFRQVAAEVLGWPEGGHSPQTPGPTPRELDRVWKAIGEIHNWWASVPAYEPEQISRLYGLAREHRWEVVFMTKRPPSAGDTVQFQTQWWLEQHGYPMPSVVTVPGSRGELANALRLDLVVDDQPLNCAEIIGASTTKTVLLLRAGEPPAARAHAQTRGIAVVSTLAETVDLVQRLHDILPQQRGRLMRLADWFGRSDKQPPALNPTHERPAPTAPPTDSSPPPTPEA